MDALPTDLDTCAKVLLDIKWYLANNIDVVNAGIDPSLHYASYGIHEQRQPHPYISGEVAAAICLQWPRPALERVRTSVDARRNVDVHRFVLEQAITCEQGILVAGWSSAPGQLECEVLLQDHKVPYPLSLHRYTRPDLAATESQIGSGAGFYGLLPISTACARIIVLLASIPVVSERQLNRENALATIEEFLSLRLNDSSQAPSELVALASSVLAGAYRRNKGRVSFCLDSSFKLDMWTLDVLLLGTPKTELLRLTLQELQHQLPEEKIRVTLIFPWHSHQGAHTQELFNFNESVTQLDLRIVALDSNVGVLAAWEHGFSFASTERVLCIGSNLLLPQDAQLQELVDSLNTDASAVFASSRDVTDPPMFQMTGFYCAQSDIPHPVLRVEHEQSSVKKIDRQVLAVFQAYDEVSESVVFAAHSAVLSVVFRILPEAYMFDQETRVLIRSLAVQGSVICDTKVLISQLEFEPTDLGLTPPKASIKKLRTLVARYRFDRWFKDLPRKAAYE